MTQRWRFVVGSTSYTLDRNPVEISRSVSSQETTYGGLEGLASGATRGYTGNAGKVGIPNLSWTGTINSQATYLQLTQLFKTRDPVTFIDHLNRTWTLRFTRFSMSAKAPKHRLNVWRQAYSVEAMVLGGPS